jgi:hypothetical protein
VNLCSIRLRNDSLQWKVWSDEARNLTFQAVNKAGFTSKYFRGLRDLIFITEPEAAALYSIKSLMMEDEDDEFLEVSYQFPTTICNY